ncbi:MAG: tRNA pseudouridine(65) synthase TruC, partial [Shewanella sp.]
THGDGKQNAFFRAHFGVNRLWLIAKKLTVTHPITLQRLEIETELESEWNSVFAGLGWEQAQLDLGPNFLLAQEV